MTTFKKIMKISVIVIAVLFLLLYLSSFVSDYLEIKESFHKNYNSIQQSLAFRDSLLPENLPETSRSIHQRHDIDTRQIWFCFSLDRGEKEKFLNKVKPAGEDILSQYRVNTPYRFTYDLLGPVEWWPKWLRKDEYRLQNVQDGIRFYKHPNPTLSIDDEPGLFILGVKQGNEKICGWTSFNKEKLYDKYGNYPILKVLKMMFSF